MLSGITVIKVGGNEVDDGAWTASLAAAVSRRSEQVVVVHGGGKEVTEVQRSLGAEPEWRDGLRVTTPEALRAVSMVLSGVVNKRLVSALVGAGLEAVGISGEDGPLLEAVPACGGLLGRTGTISGVRPRVLHALLAAGLVPVVSPVSRGPDGRPLNVNADDAAAALAVGLGASRFLMVSNVAGVLREGRVVAEVPAGEADAWVESGIATGGMEPKLRAAASAALGGVGEVAIGDLTLLFEGVGGTRVTAAPSLAATA